MGHWLRRAHQLTSANLANHIRGYQLTPPQLATLLKLRETGCISQNELGRMVAMERANIHRIVNRLARRGLLRVGKDPSDARKAVISLTDQGGELVDTLQPLHWQATRETLSVLSVAEQQQLMELLRRICRARQMPGDPTG